MKPLIIEIDKYKESFPNYDPSKAEEFHSPSAKMADIAFEKALKGKQYSKVIFLCGGSAVGKSEFISSYLADEEAIIFDSTLSSHTGVKTKLSYAKKCDVTVIFLQPKSMSACFIAFMSRSRRFHYKHFLKTHSGSREIFLFVLEKYSKVNCRYFLTEIDIGGKMLYIESKENREKTIEAIKKEQYSEEIIEAILRPFIEIFYETKKSKN